MSIVSSGYLFSSIRYSEQISPGFCIPRTFETVGKLLGSGGFGKVYKTRSIFKKEHALKVNRHVTKEEKQDNEHEATILRKIFQSGKTDNLIISSQQFVVGSQFVFHMELMEQTLADYLDNRNIRRPLELNMISSVFEQLLTATCDLYDIGYIHGDIKPKNILVSKDASGGLKVKLADYGVSCPVEEIGSFRQGTYRFMAPEIFLGIPATERIDSWSIGLVLFSMYTNYELFRGFTVYQVMEQITDVFGAYGEWLSGSDFHSFFFKNPMDSSQYLLYVPEDHVPSPKQYQQGGRNKNVYEMLKDSSRRHCPLPVSNEIRKFAELLLDPVPSERMTPKEALDYWRFCLKSYCI